MAWIRCFVRLYDPDYTSVKESSDLGTALFDPDHNLPQYVPLSTFSSIFMSVLPFLAEPSKSHLGPHGVIPAAFSWILFKLFFK